MAQDWVFLAMGLLLVMHLAVVLSALWFRSLSVHGQTEDTTVADEVTCPCCGALNEPDYKYCRKCVTELPVGISLTDGPPQGQSRRTM